MLGEIVVGGCPAGGPSLQGHVEEWKLLSSEVLADTLADHRQDQRASGETSARFRENEAREERDIAPQRAENEALRAEQASAAGAADE